MINPFNAAAYQHLKTFGGKLSQGARLLAWLELGYLGYKALRALPQIVSRLNARAMEQQTFDDAMIVVPLLTGRSLCLTFNRKAQGGWDGGLFLTPEGGLDADILTQRTGHRYSAVPVASYLLGERFTYYIDQDGFRAKPEALGASAGGLQATFSRVIKNAVSFGGPWAMATTSVPYVDKKIDQACDYLSRAIAFSLYEWLGVDRDVRKLLASASIQAEDANEDDKLPPSSLPSPSGPGPAPG